MITWLNNLVQRRGRGIFLFLLAVIIVAFVFTVGNVPGCVSADPRTARNDFFGYDLGNQATYQALANETTLALLIQTGRPPMNNEALAREIRNRVAARALAAELGIGQPDQTALRAFIESLPIFQGADGNYDPAIFDAFLSMVSDDPRYDDRQITEALIGSWQSTQVMSRIASVNLSLPTEVDRLTLWQTSRWDLATLTVDTSIWQPGIDTSEEALRSYFEADPSRFAIPAKLDLAFVRFSVDAFLDQVEDPSPAGLKAYFLENPAAFGWVTPEAGSEIAEGNPENEDAFFDANQEAILNRWKQEEATPLAEAAANKFAYDLYNRKIPFNSDSFSAILAENGLALEQLPPVSTDLSGIEGLPLSRRILSEALRIPPQFYFSNPVADVGGFVVLFREAEIPAEIPSFEAARLAVIAEYVPEKGREALMAYGTELRPKISEGLAAGRSLEEIALEYDLTLERFEDVSPAAPTFRIPAALLNSLGDFPVPGVSSLARSGENGVFLVAIARRGPTPEAYEESRQRITPELARSSGNELAGLILSEWMMREDGSR